MLHEVNPYRLIDLSTAEAIKIAAKLILAWKSRTICVAIGTLGAHPYS